jgi:hypothetical protein
LLTLFWGGGGGVGRGYMKLVRTGFTQAFLGGTVGSIDIRHFVK